MKISLGPLLYYWSREVTFAFYEAVADWPVDIVYLGETVCTRRHQLRLQDWFDLAGRLTERGKEVVVSTLPLIESESDLKILRKICENGRFTVEANDFGAVRLCVAAGVPYVAGPTLNVYNPETLAMLAESGVMRWVPPVEMNHAMLNAMPVPLGVETELFACGRLPLAYSSRCFTARHYNLQKDACEFRCLDHPDGLTLKTQEGEGFLTMNGIQTQSGNVYTLSHRLDEIKRLGVSVLRISPQSTHMDQVILHYRRCIDGQAADFDGMRPLLTGEPCDGYWLGRAGQDFVPEQPA